MPFRHLSNILLLILILPVIIGAGGVCNAQGSGIPILGAEELRAGMKGYGKTVFSGERIDTFDVEVLGVLKNWQAKSDMILVKMSGAPLDNTGIISGMSGSPVYIDDKVIGAVSYGWSFAKEAIAGVTPIKDMLNVMNLNINEAEKGLEPAQVPWQSPLFLQEPALKETLAGRGNTESHTLNLIPIGTPLVISGFDQRIVRDMSLALERYGLFPVQGGNMSELDDVVTELVPGSAVAAILASGDINASAVGTVTYRDGKNILAFGHPFIQSGKTDMPMAGAYVYAVLPSQSTSLKIAAPTKIVGRISQDRKTALAGNIGEFARMIPCLISVKGAQDVEYNFDVVDDRYLTQTLVQWATENALLATERQTGDKTVRLRLSLYTNCMERPIKIENTMYEPHPTWFPVYYITQPIASIMNNNFKAVKIEKITLEAEVTSERKVAQIQNIRIDKRYVKPDDTVKLTVTMKPFGQESVTKIIPVHIPPDTAPGSNVIISVCNSDISQALERSRAPDLFNPSSLEHLVNLLESTESNTNLIVRASIPKRGVTFKGQRLPSLPSSLLTVMSFSNQSGVSRLTDEMVYREPVEWILAGFEMLSLFVEKE
ncbi:MAG TPA: SpoIVB peptidase S55 domain-containing protein [Candidatus Avalokitesvara rifleensis]|uniref:SpoIVB peptidase S55 domain-containing protein n=1 Tax=Candidatus Avalokitesvara rifleensis TaxID=3367620 RepID=UPI0040270CA8